MKLKMPFSVNLHKLFSNKKFNITLSLVLSFAVWLVVMINQNPVRDQTFNDVAASISVENTVLNDLGLGIVSDVSTQKFSVTISGPNYIVSAVKPDDFILTASVTDVNAAGTYTLNIVGAHNSSKSGYTFSSITPSTIDVTFDYIDTMEFTLVPKIIGVKAADGLVADTPVIASTDNSTITIKGPRSIMDTITSVGAVATVNDTLSATSGYDADIIVYGENDKIIYRYGADNRIYDANNNVLETSPLTLSFTNVKITQPILKKATLRVKTVFSNLPDGISADSIVRSVDHNTVSVIGTPDVIDKISEISLSAIDIRNVSTTSNSFEVSAVLPDGVKLIDNIDVFTVTIDTSGYAEKTFTVSELKFSGLNSSVSVKSSDRIRNVKICGPASVVNSMSASDVYAAIDLTDKSAGEYTVGAVIKSNTYNQFWQIGTYNTTVKLG